MDKPFDLYKSGNYLKNNPTWDLEDSKWKSIQILNLLNKVNLKPKTIVEVGCGAGHVLSYLNKSLNNIELYGFDIAPDASKFWKKIKDRRIKFFLEDFLLNKEIKKYDLLIMLDVIEHLPNPFEFLSSINKRADHYIFHIPLDLSALSVLREKPLLYVRKKVGHIHYYTKNIALSLLAECGYKIIDYDYTGASFRKKSGLVAFLVRIIRRLIFFINRDIGVRIIGGDTLIVYAQLDKNK